MQITYHGPHEAVTVLATGQTVKRGETVEVDAAAVAASLLEQGWSEAKPTTPTADEATDKEKP